jgi:hypothetical protein
MNRIPPNTSPTLGCVWKRASTASFIDFSFYSFASSLLTFFFLSAKCCCGIAVLFQVQYVLCTDFIYHCLSVARISLSGQHDCAHPGALISCLPAAVAPFDCRSPSNVSSFKNTPSITHIISQLFRFVRILAWNLLLSESTSVVNMLQTLLK